MAKLVDSILITIANTDLGVERQNVLKEHIQSEFERLNKQDPSKDRQLQYIINQDQKPLPNVLVANKNADVVFTSFNVTRKVQSKKKKPDLILKEGDGDLLNIDPTLRFPAYQDYFKAQERGAFRLRRLFLVGDLNRLLRDLLKLGFPIQVSLYKDLERKAVYEPLDLEKAEQLPLIDGLPEGDQINLELIDSLTIGEVTFHGVINMPEENNFFVIKDTTIQDAIDKIFVLDGIKETIAKESIEQEKLLYVRKKKVMLLLNPDLKRVVAQRLKFDQMEQVKEFSELEEAKHALNTCKSAGVVEYLETNGYDVLTSLLNQAERDSIMLAMLGEKMLGGYLKKELAAFGDQLRNLKDDTVFDLFALMPEGLVDRLLLRLQKHSMESFLARIKTEIREPLILEFFKNPEWALLGWKSLEVTDRKMFSREFAANILAALYLKDTKLFRSKLPQITVTSDKDYDSAQKLGRMDQQELNFRFELFKKELANLPQINKLEWGKLFKPEEFNQVISNYISTRPDEFFNAMTPVVRKNLWTIAGKKQLKALNKALHHLDKMELLQQNKDLVLAFLKEEIGYMVGMIHDHDLELPQRLFLELKQFNRVESKTGLFKRLANNPKLRDQRIEGISSFLISPSGSSIYTKMTQAIDALAVGFDALICLKAHYEELKGHEALQGAVVTLVDDLVDDSLLKLFEDGQVDLSNYDQMAAELEAKIQGLKKQLAGEQGKDPVGGYLIETMIIMMEMTAKAMHNELDSKMIESLDDREKMRAKVMAQMEKTKADLQKKLEVYSKQLPELVEQKKKNDDFLANFSEQVSQRLSHLQEKLKEYEFLQDQVDAAKEKKRKVALVQKRLSENFFNLIKPLILSQVNRLPAQMERMLGNIMSRVTGQAPAKRMIFKFTDQEINKIMKRKIVFASGDDILKSFIVTCLNIDKLDNRLFTITAADQVPEDVELLFLGADVQDLDFSHLLDSRFITPFADEDFYVTLKTNESRKLVIRKALARFQQQATQVKAYLEKEGNQLKVMADNKKRSRQQTQKIKELYKARKLALAEAQKTLAFLEEEQHSFADKFSQIDQKFQNVKEQISQAVSQGSGTVETITQGVAKLADGLTNKMMEINKELSELMFLKNVKDTGEKISQATQKGIVSRIDKLSRFKGGLGAIQELALAADGSMDSVNLTRVMQPALKKYLGKIEPTELTLGRMETNIIEGDRLYSILIIVTDDQKNKLGQLKDLVKRLKTKKPQTHIIVFTPYDVLEAEEGSLMTNMNALRDHCMLVNTNTADFTNENKFMQFLHEFIPL